MYCMKSASLLLCVFFEIRRNEKYLEYLLSVKVKFINNNKEKTRSNKINMLNSKASKIKVESSYINFDAS